MHKRRNSSRLRLKCDGTREETRFRLSAKRTTPFKSAGSVSSVDTGSRGVRISGSNAGYTMLRGSVRGTGYPLHWTVSPSLPLPGVTVSHHISTGIYQQTWSLITNNTIGDSGFRLGVVEVFTRLVVRRKYAVEYRRLGTTYLSLYIYRHNSLFTILCNDTTRICLITVEVMLSL